MKSPRTIVVLILIGIALSSAATGASKKSGDDLCHDVVELSHLFRKEKSITEVKEYITTNYVKPNRIEITDDGFIFFYTGKPVRNMKTVIRFYAKSSDTQIDTQIFGHTIDTQTFHHINFECQKDSKL